MRDHAQNHRGYVGSLTGLRGFAALWVMLYHAWVTSTPTRMDIEFGTTTIDLTPLFSGGWAGVDFFFVLSAFLLTLPFARWACGERSYPSAWPYLKRRIRRVFPAFWAQLIILLIVAYSTSMYVFPATKGLITHVLMAFHLPPTWTKPINGVWWTLPTEFLFYLLLLPLGFLLKTRATRVVLLFLLMGAWAYRWWVFETFNEQGVGKMVVLMGNIFGALDLFIIGTFCAWLYVSKYQPGKLRLPPSIFLILGMSGVLMCLYSIQWVNPGFWEGHWLLYLKNTLMGVSIASVIISILLGSKLALGLFGNPVIMHAGVISYSVYLWHLPVIIALSKWSYFVNYPGYKLPIMLAFSIPLVWLISYCSYRFVERPFLQRREKQ